METGPNFTLINIGLTFGSYLLILSGHIQAQPFSYSLRGPHYLSSMNPMHVLSYKHKYSHKELFSPADVRMKRNAWSYMPAYNKGAIFALESRDRVQLHAWDSMHADARWRKIRFKWVPLNIRTVQSTYFLDHFTHLCSTNPLHTHTTSLDLAQA